MRKTILYILALPLIMAYACSANEDYLLYDTTQKDELYIYATEETDSVHYNFGYDNITEDTVWVEVRLVGMPKEHNRVFNLEANNDRYASETYPAAKAEYYTMPEQFLLKADSVIAKVPIILHRHNDLKTNGAIVTVDIKSSDDLDVNGHSEFTFTFDDFLPPTPYWWTYSTNVADLGEYTMAKYIKIIELFRAYGERDPYMYATIVALYGEYLNAPTGTSSSGYYSMRFYYPLLFRENIWMPLYEFQESPENDGSISGVTNPF